ncbi:Uncharacterised protein [Clostridium perfringens]|uniref:Uncharacterized protein n=1 Tax=Clostridium perfringens TaxID=1502 RepID=A0A2X2YH58_CLOPF|nr:hypothetical protein [Clostridium perfringens]NGT46648.1 hypothetical protein [Clostridium perfringens]SQB59845.1 Uncharacterised protein [Clostridium perfringens]
MNKKYYYEILKLDDDSLIVEIDEIVIRIDFKLEIQDLESMIHSLENITYIQDAEATISSMGFKEFFREYYSDNTDQYLIIYSSKESLKDDYRKIKAKFPKTYISLELINGDFVLLTEEEYLKEYGKIDIDKRLFLDGCIRDEFEHFREFIDDILENISINEEQRKIIEKFKKIDTYRDLTIDEYNIIRNLFNLDEMEG